MSANFRIFIYKSIYYYLPVPVICNTFDGFFLQSPTEEQVLEEKLSHLGEDNSPYFLKISFEDGTPRETLQKALKKVKELFQGYLHLSLYHAQENFIDCDDIVRELEGAR